MHKAQQCCAAGRTNGSAQCQCPDCLGRTQAEGPDTLCSLQRFTVICSIAANMLLSCFHHDHHMSVGMFCLALKPVE